MKEIQTAFQSRVMAGLVPAIHVLLAELRKKGVDAREDGVPAACRGGVSLRGHDELRPIRN
jgi:hypothetical protein